MAVTKIILKDRDEWLRHRKKGLGGSDISAVVGLNPYKDNQTLWKEKRGIIKAPDISDKPYVQYGTKAEEHLRELFCLDFPQYKVFYDENNSFKNDKYPWRQASLDGWLVDEEGKKGILEIKTTEILRSSQKEKWNNAIPQNYYCQVLFYMAVCEADFVILKAQLKTVFEKMPYLQTKHYYIDRKDCEEDIEYLMTKGAEFWEKVEKGIMPDLLLPEV